MMYADVQRNRTWFLRLFLCSIMSGLVAPSVWAQSATRDLSGFVDQGVVFTVTITITPPGSFLASGLEDTVPPGWTVSSITNGGTWDAENETVKWGIFTSGDLPAAVMYDVLPPTGEVGERCFQGEISFDGSFHDIDGDLCLSVGVPATSTWGLIAFSLLILGAGTVAIRSRWSPGVR